MNDSLLNKYKNTLTNTNASKFCNWSLHTHSETNNERQKTELKSKRIPNVHCTHIENVGNFIYNLSPCVCATNSDLFEQDNSSDKQKMGCFLPMTNGNRPKIKKRTHSTNNKYTNGYLLRSKQFKLETKLRTIVWSTTLISDATIQFNSIFFFIHLSLTISNKWRVREMQTYEWKKEHNWHLPCSIDNNTRFKGNPKNRETSRVEHK